MSNFPQIANGLPVVTNESGNLSNKVLIDVVQNPEIGAKPIHGTTEEADILAKYQFDNQPNNLVEIDRTTYERLLSQARAANVRAYGLIELKEGREVKYYAVGDEVVGTNVSLDHARRQRTSKYAKGYFDVFAMAMIARIYRGRVPERINFVGSHPPSNADKAEEMSELMKNRGKPWVFKSAGEEHSVKIETTLFINEVQGGIFHLSYGTDGRPKRDNPIPSNVKTILFFDMGGGTTEVVIAKRNGQPIRVASLAVGGTEILTQYRHLINQKYQKRYWPNSNDLAMSKVYEALLHPKHLLRIFTGDPDNPIAELETEPMLREAATPTLMALPDQINVAIPDWQTAADLAVGGGGMGSVLIPYLGEIVFPSYASAGALIPGADPKYSLYANTFGMRKFAEMIRLANVMEMRKSQS